VWCLRDGGVGAARVGRGEGAPLLSQRKSGEISGSVCVCVFEGGGRSSVLCEARPALRGVSPPPTFPSVLPTYRVGYLPGRGEGDSLGWQVVAANGVAGVTSGAWAGVVLGWQVRRGRTPEEGLGLGGWYRTLKSPYALFPK
jgi:hypothetical protein